MSEDTQIQQAVAHLTQGGVVAAATESFFGLLADVRQPGALEKVFSLKPRGADKGVPLLLPVPSAWAEVARHIPPLAVFLANEFWPGPLSIALPAREGLDSRIVLDGSVAVRWPGTCPAAKIAALVGAPLTASSANKPGEPPATDAESVRRSFPEAIASGVLFVLEGTSPGGAPSTVIVVGDDGYKLAREARVARSELEAAVARFRHA
jgi:L-threonylcarbamoyladenylate synthase